MPLVTVLTVHKRFGQYYLTVPGSGNWFRHFSVLYGTTRVRSRFSVQARTTYDTRDPAQRYNNDNNICIHLSAVAAQKRFGIKNWRTRRYILCQTRPLIFYLNATTLRTRELGFKRVTMQHDCYIERNLVPFFHRNLALTSSFRPQSSFRTLQCARPDGEIPWFRIRFFLVYPPIICMHFQRVFVKRIYFRRQRFNRNRDFSIGKIA